MPTKTLKDMDDKREKLEGFVKGLEFEVLHNFSEKVKNTKDGKVEDFTDEDKIGIGIDVYKKLESLFGEFGAFGAGNDFGKYAAERVFEVISGVRLVDFAKRTASKFGLEGLTENYSLIASELSKSLQEAIIYGAEVTDIENIGKEMADESKDRYHKELDEKKMKGVNDLIKVYSALRNGLSPENFIRVISDYTK